MTPVSPIIAHPRVPSKRTPALVLGAIALLTLLIAPPARANETATSSGAFPELRFSAATLSFADRRVDGLRGSLEPGGHFTVSMEGFDAGQGGARLSGMAFDGVLNAFELGEEGIEANGLLRYRGLETDWSLSAHDERLSACLVTLAQPLSALAGEFGIPSQVAWLKSGEVDTCIRYGETAGSPARLSVDVALSDVAFDSPDGVYAGEGLAADLFFETALPGIQGGELSGTLKGGALLLQNFYADFGSAPVEFEAQPLVQGKALSGARFAVNDGGALRMAADLSVEAGGSWSVDLEKITLVFPEAYNRYLEPIAAAWTLDGLTVTGELAWSGAWGANGLRSGNLDISDLSVVDTARDRFALTGLNTRLRPGDYDFDSTLTWRGLLLGRINLGPGVARLDAQPGAFALVEPLDLDVLGGQFRLERLAYVLPGSPASASGQPRMELQAGLSDIDMSRLTSALDWPAFSGTLSGEIPRVKLVDGVLSVDGEISVNVFGGQIVVRDLATERPFGVLPSLAANVDMKDLDLEQLTETFEFGRIGGRVDGYVHGLRLLDWRPVAFDAWLGTPKRRSGTSAISRQAVNHLASIGGGGAASALSGPLLRMFNNFSYRRLGLGCRLQNNLCSITGLSEDGQSVLLLEGAGIPKITVRAWNRQVDWPQMVANLVAISEGDEIRVGDGP